MLVLTVSPTLRAATIARGDVTTSLGPGFFVDDAADGGTDTDINQPNVAAFNRFFAGLLTRNQGPARVTLTGFGFAAHTSATANDATSVAVTFTYLGADELLGGGDDVVLGTATGTYNFTVGGEYVFAFDSPLTANLTITGIRFRIQIAPTNGANVGSLKLKTAALSYETTVGPKLSVAGFVSPLINPRRLNLAKFQPVTASTVSGQRLASYLTDGVTGNDNRWQSANSQWNTARVDFPFPVEVGSAQVFSGVDDTFPVGNFSIQYLEGGTWLTIPGASVSGNTDVERNLVFTNPVTASSFRIIGQDNPLRIRELALYPPNGPGGYPLGTDLTTNLAYQRQAVASANTVGNFALNAVDGRASAFLWQTDTAGTNTLDIDLRISTKIGSAHLYSGSTGVPPLANFVLKYWDGTTWLNIPGGTVAGNATSDLVVPFTTPIPTTKVRLEFTNPGITSIRELGIFPANTGNTGYPIGTNIIESGAIAKYDDYSDDFYQISSPSSSRFIAVADGQPALDQAGLTTAQGQYQVLLNISTGSYRLRNRATGNCLSGAQLSKTPGALLTDAPYSALPHQDWLLQPLGGESFQLINQWSGLVIDTQDGNPSAGTPLVQNLNTGSNSQRWQLLDSAKYPKKGIGGTSFATSFNVSWAYNWGMKNTHSLPAHAVYNPMQWGDYNWTIGSDAGPNWQYYSSWRTTSQALHHMGFNEPDAFSQSGRSLDTNVPQNESEFSATRSLAEAVLLWPRLQAMDQPLASPAPANMNNGWLASFYTQAASLGYRVDYTALHSYPGPGGGSADDLINTLLGGYNSWNRPVWLTEFSFVNWSGTGTWTEEDNYNCLAEFLWRAESLPWLRKYALFVFTESATAPAPAQPWSGVGPRSNAYDINGNLTPFGQLYAAWDNDASVATHKVYFVHNKHTRKRLANTLNSAPGGRSIRISDSSVKWTLVPGPTSNQYYITSARDGRRLSSDGTSVSQVAAGTTGTAVLWSLTEDQHGWFYLGHPATSKRLQLAYNNTDSTATYTMVANTNAGDAGLWRFIVPPPAPTWSGTTSTSWATPNNWLPGIVPAPGDTVHFASSSSTNLNTVLDQDFDLRGLTVSNPAAPVSIGGTHSLTLGANGIDLAGASQDLTITTPVVLSAPQSWIVASGRTLNLNGGLAGAFPLSIGGAGIVSPGAAIDPMVPITVASGGTLKPAASGVLASGASAVNPVIIGTLDLNGTHQSVNSLTGSGVIDNTAPGAAQLTVGNNDTAVTLNVLLQNSGGALALVKTGSGALTLPAANNHGGGLTNNGTGNVVPQHGSAFGTGPVVMNAGTIYPTLTCTFSNALTLNGGGLRIGGGTGKSITWTGPVSVTTNSEIRADGNTSGVTVSNTVTLPGATLTSFAGGGSLGNTISGSINGSGTLIVTGGTLNLNAANPFSGTVRPTAGILKIGDPLAMQNATLDMNAVDAGAVSFNNLNATLGSLTGSRNLGLGDGTVSIGNSHLNTAYSGILSGSGSLVKIGNGTLTIAGANTYAGTTRVHAGTLALGATNALPNASAVSIANATLDAASFTDTVGTLNVTHPAAKINLGSGAALVFATSSSQDWGSGTLTLTGTFVSGFSLRFGNTSNGLTPGQISRITAAGVTSFALDQNGFLVIGGYDTWKAQITNGLNLRSDDADGDGWMNLDEFLFGSSPTTSNSSLMTTTASGSNLILRWLQRESGATYLLKQSSTLAAESWTLVSPQSPALDDDQSGAPSDYDYYSVTLPTGSGTSLFRIEGMEN